MLTHMLGMAGKSSDNSNENVLPSSRAQLAIERMMNRHEPMKVLSASELGRICRAAEKLTPLERDVLSLSSAKGLLIPEIALTLGMSESRTKRIFVRALCKFDRALHQLERPWWHFW